MFWGTAKPLVFLIFMKV